ncbi:hypothetical protein B0T17DRAFT_218142 [Bombardia bombarda]|uniref:Uncharacterized protein n=1 Tax=Bombardia bombarda TaxID=252184 RepID=A0AA39XBP5_9PEZI|nr:hypothetical protein B0T17DRAFT_218142 [Bombardia bombarda]
MATDSINSPIAAAAATSSALANQTRATAIEIDAFRTARPNDVAALKKLAYLSIKLRQFSQHAEQLGDILAAAPPLVSQKVKAVLAQALPECDKATQVISSEVRRVVGSGDASVQAIDPAAVEVYDALLVTHSRIFIFVMQILSFETEAEQDHFLETKDVQQLLTKLISGRLWLASML